MAAVIRIKLGKLGAGAADWGLEIYNASGVLMFGLTGAPTVGVIQNAVVVGAAFSNDGIVSINGATAETELGTVTISTPGGAVDIFAKGSVATDTPSAWPLILRIRKDSLSGTILDEVRTTTSLDGATNNLGYDGSPASTQTYKFSGVIGSGDSGMVSETAFRRLVAVARKR